jgi:hypothetical protein
MRILGYYFSPPSGASTRWSVNSWRFFMCGLCLVVSLVAPIQGHDGATSSSNHEGKVATATRIDDAQRPRLDGRLDEPIWQTLEPATDFMQREPDFGEAASQRTEVRFCYDDENLYVGIRCFDTQPEAIVRRLSQNESEINGSDAVNIFIDSRHDHRTGIKFGVNSMGMRDDQIRYNDNERDNSWDGYWWVESRIDSLGWIAELKIPFKNFRFDDDGNDIWGLNIERKISRRNEQSFWKPVSRDDGRATRISKLSHLKGIRGVKAGRRFETILYGLQGMSRSAGTGARSTTETGLDLKYAVTPNLTLDTTINPDFAQVEADIDEINLTRFPTRFSEQRPFFVEGNSAFLTPMDLYYSRRIGGRADIIGGGKLTGKAGPYTIGLASVQTGDWTYFGIQDADSTKEEATFHVVRLKRDVFARSNVGILIADKAHGGTHSRVGGIDFSMRPGDFYFINAQVAGSWNDGSDDGNTGITVDFARNTDLVSLGILYERYAPDFDINQTGFLRTERFRGTEEARLDFEYSPRPEDSIIRQISFGGWFDAQKPLVTDRYLDDQTVRFPGTTFSSDFLDEHRGFGSGVSAELSFDSGTRVEFSGSRQRRYDITGGFNTDMLEVRLGTPDQYKMATDLTASVSNFYNFDQRHMSREWGFNLEAIFLPLDQWRIETRLGHSSTFDPNDALEDRIWLGSIRTVYLFSPDTFVRLFFQARTDRTPLGTEKSFLISNVFGWEFRRGSRLFVAFNESRDDGSGVFKLNNQTVVFKIAHQIDM